MAETDLTAEKLLENDELVDTLIQHSQDRYGETPKTKEEALETFLEDYRAVQSNTYSAVKFKNYVENMTDDSKRKALGKLYETVDNNLESFAGKGGILGGLYDYVRYGITDPLNIFGLGAGKIVASTAGRAVVGKLIRDSFAKGLAKNPIPTAAITGGLTEGAISGTGSYLVEEVKGKEGLGIQDDINYKNILRAAGYGTLFGGAVGGIAGAFGRKATQNVDDLKAQMQSAAENTPQGQSAKSNNMLEHRDKLAKEKKVDRQTGRVLSDENDIIGSFVERFETVAPENVVAQDIKISYPKQADLPTVSYRGVELKIGDELSIKKQVNDKGKTTGYSVGDQNFSKITEAKEFVKNRIRESSPNELGITDDLITKSTITDNDYSKFGLITDFKDDVAEVKYLPTTYKNKINPKTGKYDEKKILNIELSKLKGVSENRKKEYISSYVENYDKFLDKAKIEEAKSFLLNNKISKTEVDDIFSVALSKETFEDLVRFTFDTGMEIQKLAPERKLGKQINVILDDPSKRITEKIGDLIELSAKNPDVLGDIVSRAAAKNNLTPNQIASLVRAEASISMSKGADASAVQRLLNKSTDLGKEINRVTSNLTKSQQATVKALQREAEIERAAARKFGVSVDVWRSYLVSQPATTLRNIIGSVLRVPGETLNTALRRYFQSIEAEALGIKPPKDIVGQDIGLLAKNLLRPQESVEIARILADNFTEADRRIFKVFDDYFSSSLSQEADAGKLLKTLHKGSQYVNVLNRMQDRTIKSVGFLTELDNQIKQAINRGEIPRKFKNVRDLISNNRLDLINDKMVDESLKFAYKMTYQNRRAGDDLIIGGRTINALQSTLNRASAIKLGLPFPNFIINSAVYTLNRTTPFGLAKLATSSFRVAKQQGAKKGKDLIKKEARRAKKIEKEIFDLKSITKSKAKLTSEDSNKLRVLEEELGQLQARSGRRLKNVEQLRQGIQETLEGGVLIAVGYGIREKFGGARYDELVINGETYDVGPLFPLTPYLYMGELVRKMLNGERISGRFMGEGLEVLTGIQVDRAGALPRAVANFIKEVNYLAETGNTERAYDKLGAVVGGMFGYALTGYATPFKAFFDLGATVSGPENRIKRERSLQTVFTPGEVSNTATAEFFKGAVDQFLRAMFSGTPFEDEIFNRNLPKLTGATLDLQVDNMRFGKQLFGVASKKQSEVERELDKLDYPIWKLIPRSNVNEYSYAYKRELGILVDDIVYPETLQNPNYQNAPEDAKRDFMRALFTGKGYDRSPRVKKAFRDAGYENFNNIKEIANQAMIDNYPELTKLKKFRDSPRDAVSKAIEKFKRIQGRDPDLKWGGNIKDATGRKQERLIRAAADVAVLTSYLKSSDKAASDLVSQKQRQRVNKREGGYVSQMNALGF